MRRRGRVRNAAWFSFKLYAAQIVGRTPWSAADPPVGLLTITAARFFQRRAGPGGPARTRGSAPQIVQPPQNWENQATAQLFPRWPLLDGDQGRGAVYRRAGASRGDMNLNLHVVPGGGIAGEGDLNLVDSDQVRRQPRGDYL